MDKISHSTGQMAQKEKSGSSPVQLSASGRPSFFQLLTAFRGAYHKYKKNAEAVAPREIPVGFSWALFSQEKILQQAEEPDQPGEAENPIPLQLFSVTRQNKKREGRRLQQRRPGIPVIFQKIIR